MIWQKVKSIFSTDTEKEFGSNKENQPLSYLNQPETDDVLFAKKFNAAGGHFLYCENHQEFVHALQSILSENNSPQIICFDKKLQSILNKLDIEFSTEIDNSLLNQHNFLFIPCEYLIAFDGSIMVSSDQTKIYKVSELPYNIIVYANLEQIATNLSFALRGIKRYKNDCIPNNITCIKGNKSDHFESLPNAKNIYLLMIE